MKIEKPVLLNMREDYSLSPWWEEADSVVQIHDGPESGTKGFEIRTRAFEFACSVHPLCERLAQSFTGRIVAKQLFRAATSIGSNLEEADAAHSRADFTSKCGISLKEAREARYWLKLIERTQNLDVSALIDEARQMVAILTTIVRKTREGEK